ncbi:MAG: hypothetical protein PWQ17_2484 [Anaerophaga sp.]|jgi:hypothetical protein|nr:hypothetical protein [Anaerophaga sp.]
MLFYCNLTHFVQIWQSDHVKVGNETLFSGKEDCSEKGNSLCVQKPKL